MGEIVVDLGIKGKKALLAGASAGMGKASALALAKEGVEIYISARGGDRLTECAKEIGDTTGVKVVPIVAVVVSILAAASMTSTLEETGPICNVTFIVAVLLTTTVTPFTEAGLNPDADIARL